MSARDTEPPRPGRMPTANPIAMPASIVRRVVGSKIPSRLLKNVSSMRKSSGWEAVSAGEVAQDVVQVQDGGVLEVHVEQVHLVRQRAPVEHRLLDDGDLEAGGVGVH